VADWGGRGDGVSASCIVGPLGMLMTVGSLVHWSLMGGLLHLRGTL